MKRLIFLTLLLSILGGCGSSGDPGQPVPPLAPFNPTVWRLGVIAPLEAGQTEFGLGIRNSAQLAVDQWNAHLEPFGPFFELVALDDSSDPAVGRAAAQQLAADPSVIGVVGTYNSGVAEAVLPILESAGIVMISPGNTDPALTLGPNPNSPVRQFGNYFRLVVPDTFQGPRLAEYAFNTLNVTRVAVVTESKDVSRALADAFSDRFIELGGTILTTQVAPEGTTDYSALLANVAPTAPQLLFYAGEVPNASIVRNQATQAGIVVPLMGGDGMKSQTYIEEATVPTEGDIASSVGIPAELLPEGQNFLNAYDAAGFTDPPGAFGPYAYDAASALMLAAYRSGNSRGDIRAFLEQLDVEGLTGRIAFDAFGDTLEKTLTIFEVQNGVFQPVEVVD